MDITTRGLWTMIHGMGFGALYLLACSGAIVEIWRRYSPAAAWPANARDEAFLRVYLVVMAVLGWFAVLSGAYIVYPWYRAAAPAGTLNLAGYPQLPLKSDPAASGWQSLGMEWKELVAWLAPISITMACAVFFRYGRGLRNHPQASQCCALFCAGPVIVRRYRRLLRRHDQQNAPVQGGGVIHLMQGGER